MRPLYALGYVGGWVLGVVMLTAAAGVEVLEAARRKA